MKIISIGVLDSGKTTVGSFKSNLFTSKAHTNKSNQDSTKEKRHYMPVKLLKSQFDTLEEPKNIFIVDISNTSEAIIQIIRKELNL